MFAWKKKGKRIDSLSLPITPYGLVEKTAEFPRREFLDGVHEPYLTERTDGDWSSSSRAANAQFSQTIEAFSRRPILVVQFQLDHVDRAAFGEYF
jgi:hypothetical protein